MALAGTHSTIRGRHLGRRHDDHPVIAENQSGTGVSQPNTAEKSLLSFGEEVKLGGPGAANRPSSASVAPPALIVKAVSDGDHGHTWARCSGRR